MPFQSESKYVALKRSLPSSQSERSADLGVLDHLRQVNDDLVGARVALDWRGRGSNRPAPTSTECRADRH